MAHTEGTWLYNAVTGEVYVRTGGKPKGTTRVLATIVVPGDAPDEVEEGDSNGELCALAPQLAELVRDFAAQSCNEGKVDGDRCGECLVCRAKDLNDEVPL